MSMQRFLFQSVHQLAALGQLAIRAAAALDCAPTRRSETCTKLLTFSNSLLQSFFLSFSLSASLSSFLSFFSSVEP
jgi:hypothetical protein